jgi:uncharacterized protein
MKPQISVITLGVDDLEKAVEFYRDGLGLATEGIVGTEFEHGAVAFFDLQAGLKLALWSRDDIAHDTGLSKAPGSPTEMTVGHNVGSEAEVEQVMAEAAEAGAKILKAGAPTFWGGYAGYFQDLDGHVWEVVWNPAWSSWVTNNDDAKAPAVEDLEPGEAREVLRQLCKRGGSIQNAVAEEIEACLRTVDVDVVAGGVFTDLELLTREDLWDRSGETSHGYSDPAEVAWEMVEEVIRPYMGEIDRYWKLGMKEEAFW